MTTSPSPGVTTPPTDEQRELARALSRAAAYPQTPNDYESGATAIAQVLADQAAAIHARYEKDQAEMLRHYSAALDEVWRLRSAMAYEAGVLAAHLDYKTFPKTRQPIATQQLARMTAVASGSAATPYSHVSSRSMETARRQAGVGTLTRSKWEDR